ncbi:DUF983 domain-containing protein [Methylorubrum zatmanii]|uniref:DUF983 domain-containing protein n=1 Tax=Methylorubrum zatmanii TaxID=29429 RepID=A0ABW1WJV6_9HYPH|nr:DUF983 domain-containing protein [Methylorubrum zatmanii]MBD8909369.1 hypothetical protein [Methylorubrum zatmanii]
METQAFPSPSAPQDRTRLMPAMARGFLNRCPHCGGGHMFGRFLKVRPACQACGLEMEGHRADDLPPYLVIFLVGHIVGYLVLKVEMGYDMPLWASLTLWPLLTLVLALALLQPMKGAVIGLQYAFGMHGFGKAPPARGGTGTGERRGGEAGTRADRAPGLGSA